MRARARGCGEDGRGEVRRRLERLSAEARYELARRVAPDRRDDPRAAADPELDGGCADPAGAAVHEQRLARVATRPA